MDLWQNRALICQQSIGCHEELICNVLAQVDMDPKRLWDVSCFDSTDLQEFYIKSFSRSAVLLETKWNHLEELFNAASGDQKMFIESSLSQGKFCLACSHLYRNTLFRCASEQ